MSGLGLGSLPMPKARQSKVQGNMLMGGVNDKKGHRERLRHRFLARENSALTDEALLELLLTYAIPRVDVQPLARDMLATFGSLSGVIAATSDSLCKVRGINEQSATLLNLVSEISSCKSRSKAIKNRRPVDEFPLLDSHGFLETRESTSELSDSKRLKLSKRKSNQLPQNPQCVQPSKASSAKAAKQSTGIFGKALLKEAIEILPRLPEGANYEAVRTYVQSSLHFSGQQTRVRNTSYILRRMFPNGTIDEELLRFARRFEGTTELKEVCFYRFLKVELLLGRVIENVLMPAMTIGRTTRARIRDYLAEQFPDSRSLKDGARAVLDAITAGGFAKEEGKRDLTFQLRDVPLASFAFILHSEFADPGMHTFVSLFDNPFIQQMLWKRESVVAALYELRNRKILSKVSEIDNFRQFTTKYELHDVVATLAKEVAA
jgi:hypothetical protein